MSYKIEAPWAELRPLFRYINEILGCSCFPDLLERGRQVVKKLGGR